MGDQPHEGARKLVLRRMKCSRCSSRTRN